MVGAQGRGAEQVQRGPLVLCGPVRRSVPPAGQIIQTLGAEEAGEAEEARAGQCEPGLQPVPQSWLVGLRNEGKWGGGGDREAQRQGFSFGALLRVPRPPRSLSAPPR